MASTDVKSGDLFFLYGLLRVGSSNMPEDIDLVAGGEFLGPAFMQGDLYDVGGFPGIVKGTGNVGGLLYRLDDVSLVPAMDAFEDVVDGDPESSMYQRIRKPLFDSERMDTGKKAWVYWYNQSVEGFEKIEDGDWPLNAALEAYKKQKPSLVKRILKGILATVMALFAFVLISLVIGIVFSIQWLTTSAAVLGAVFTWLIVFFGKGTTDQIDAPDVMGVRED